ncbi:hypothetical protein Tco_1419280 [Tanacetum coccineum]
MLAPRLAKALQEKVLLKLHRIRKLPGFPSLGGTLFSIIAELSSLKKAAKIFDFMFVAYEFLEKFSIIRHSGQDIDERVMASIRAIILSVLELLLPSSAKATVFLRDDWKLPPDAGIVELLGYLLDMIEDFDNVAFGQIVNHGQFRSFLIQSKRRLEIRSRVERKLRFLRGVDFEEFVNVFIRIGFGSSIKLVSLDKSQVVTFDSKFVSSFRNSDCTTRSRSDNMVDCFFDRMELFCFVDDVFDSEYVQVQVMVQQVQNWKHVYASKGEFVRVYNIRTRKVEENLHIRFLEDKPIIVGDGPKWLFDIDVLTKSLNYVPVVAGTNSNNFVGIEESVSIGLYSKETGSSQDYILMLLLKDGSLFDSSSKSASNDEPQPSSDAGKKDDEGVSQESGIDDQERPKNSTQDVNTDGPSINTASTNVNTGSLNINIVSLTVTTVPLEATHADFFGDETELDMSNITTTYLVPTTPNIRIHKDHLLDHVIGDVQSGVQTRRMTKTSNKQGFISVVYEGKTH